MGVALYAQAEVVYLTTSDQSEKNNSFTNCLNWSDGKVAHDDADYRVDSGRTMRTSVYGGVFGGNLLMIGNPDNLNHQNSGVNSRARNAYETTWARDGLVLVAGKYYQGNDSAGVGIVNGKVTVQASNDAPFRFHANGSNKGLDFTGDFHGDATRGLLIGGNRLSEAETNFTCRLRGDMSDYLGTITVTNICDEQGVPLGTTFFAAASSFPGTVCVRTNALMVTATNDVSFGTLHLDSGSRVRLTGDPSLGKYGAITVTDSFTMGENVSLDVTYSFPESLIDGTTTQRIALVTVPYASELSLDGFDVTLADASGFGHTHRLAVESDESQRTKSLVCVIEPSVILDVPDSPNANTTLDLAKHNDGAISDESKWSDKKVPHEGAHYFVPCKAYGKDWKECCLRIVGNNPYEFLGLSLTLADEYSSITVFPTEFTCDRLIMRNGSTVRAGNLRSPTVKGNILANDGTVYFGCYGDKTMTIAAGISGTAKVVFRGYDGETSNKDGFYRLTGDNSRFEGTMEVTSYGASSQNENFQQLILSSPASLGADLPAFNFEALSLAKWARLKVDKDVTLAKESNRGLFVNGNAQVDVVDGKVFQLDTGLSLNGRLLKIGKGVFAVGGAAGFGANGDSDPVTDSNVLELTNGTVKVTSVDAVNGVSFRVGSNGSLSLKVDPSDAELMRYGIRNVRTADPLSLIDGAEKVRIDLDTSAYPELPAEGALIGILTVQDVATNAVDSVLSISRSYSGFSRSIVKIHDDENGWTTYAEKYCHPGFHIHVR